MGYALVAGWVFASTIACILGLWRQWGKATPYGWLSVAGSLSALAFATFWLLPSLTQIDADRLVASAGGKATQLQTDCKPGEARAPDVPNKVEELGQMLNRILMASEAARSSLESKASEIKITLKPQGPAARDLPPQQIADNVIEFFKELQSLRSNDDHLNELLSIAGRNNSEWTGRREDKITTLETVLRNCSSGGRDKPGPQCAGEARTDQSEWLRTGRSGDLFAVELSPVQNLVRGRQGTYYAVNLNSRQDASGFQFEQGQYVLTPGDAEQLARAAGQVVAEVINRIPRGVQISMFARGNATSANWVGDPAQESDMLVLKGSPGTGYGPSFEKHIVKPKPDNRDLPNLRAAYVQRTLSAVPGLGSIAILDGQPGSSNDARLKRVDLFLLIDW